MTVYINGTTGYSGPVGVLGDLTTTGNTILGDQSTDTLNVANGNLVLDASGDLGLGVTPSAWSSSYKAFEQVGGSIWSINSQNILLSQNSYNNGTNNIYKTSSSATQYQQSNGQHFWFNAPSGTAGNVITFTQAMTLDASGNFILGATSANGRARIVGVASNDCIVNLETSTNNYASGLVLTALNDNGAIYNYIISKTNGGTEHWKIGGVGASSTLAFSTGGTERARIDSGGNFGLGVVPSLWQGSGPGQTALQTMSWALSNDVNSHYQTNNAYYGSAAWRYIASKFATRYDQDSATGQHRWFYAPSGSAGNGISWTQAMTLDSSGNLSFGSTWGYIRQFSGYLGIGSSNVALMCIDDGTPRVIPRTGSNTTSNGVIDLGDAGSRYKALFASNGTIQTSDAREKTPVVALTANEIEAAKQLANEIGTYKWLEAVTSKGFDNARDHVGMTVQRAIEVMEAHGLDAMKYGFICYDTWPEEKNEEGGLIRPAGDSYSFRTDQLGLFISRGQQAIIQQLQADVAALKGAA
jgi:hypothetical protein